MYTVFRKTTLVLHTITSIHIHRFSGFWQRCCWERMLSNGGLLSHLS